MSLTARLEAAVDAFLACFEAERAYLEAHFFARYADEIAEHGLPEGMEPPDPTEAAEGLRPWCSAEVMQADEGDRLPGIERLTRFAPIEALNRAGDAGALAMPDAGDLDLVRPLRRLLRVLGVRGPPRHQRPR